MLSAFKKLILPITVLLATCFTFAAPASAFNLFSPCTGKVATSGPCQSAATGGNGNDPVVTTINTAANIIALITGIAAVVMIIIGALTMASSAGNTEAVAAARRRVIFSVVGLIVVALAWTITRFVTDNVIK